MKSDDEHDVPSYVQHVVPPQDEDRMQMEDRREHEEMAPGNIALRLTDVASADAKEVPTLRRSMRNRKKTGSP